MKKLICKKVLFMIATATVFSFANADEKSLSNPMPALKGLNEYVSFNGVLCKEIEVKKLDNAEASFRYKFNFQKNYSEFDQYIESTNMKWKEYPKDVSLNGMTSGGFLILNLTAPFAIKSISLKAVIGNHADKKERTAFLKYSFDGKKYKILAKKKYKGGANIKVEGNIDFKNAKSSKIWLKIKKHVKKNKRYIILKSLDIFCRGKINEVQEGELNEKGGI